MSNMSSTPVIRRSAVADFELIVADRSFSVAQVAPDFIILQTATEIPPGPAMLFIRIEGRETRRTLELPDGASASSTRVRIVRQ